MHCVHPITSSFPYIPLGTIKTFFTDGVGRKERKISYFTPAAKEASHIYQIFVSDQREPLRALHKQHPRNKPSITSHLNSVLCCCPATFFSPLSYSGFTGLDVCLFSVSDCGRYAYLRGYAHLFIARVLTSDLQEVRIYRSLQEIRLILTLPTLLIWFPLAEHLLIRSLSECYPFFCLN